MIERGGIGAAAAIAMSDDVGEPTQRHGDAGEESKPPLWASGVDDAATDPTPSLISVVTHCSATTTADAAPASSSVPFADAAAPRLLLVKSVKSDGSSTCADTASAGYASACADPAASGAHEAAASTPMVLAPRGRLATGGAALAEWLRERGEEEGRVGEDGHGASPPSRDEAGGGDPRSGAAAAGGGGAADDAGVWR